MRLGHVTVHVKVPGRFRKSHANAVKTLVQNDLASFWIEIWWEKQAQWVKNVEFTQSTVAL